MATKSPPSSPGTDDQKREYVFKVLVIGEAATGKTAIIKRYVHNAFSEHYKTTVGVDFALKLIKYDNNTTIRLQLWDIAGGERFSNMTRAYYKEAVGCIVVFDITRGATFDAVSKWKTDLDNKVLLPNGDPVPCILLANKCDLPKENFVISNEQIDDYCQDKNFLKWFETSAKENINIETSVRYLISEILRLTTDFIPKERTLPQTFPTPASSSSSSSSSSCCGGKS